MQLGHHFGKRKPSWNMFHERTRLYFQSLDNTILKFSFLISTIQFVVLMPLLFWTLENYTLFEHIIPINTNLKDNIDSEKKWILFLFGLSYIISVFINFQTLKIILQKKETEMQKTNSVDFIDRTFSSDAAADQRHAS
jgi:hypothetical protein